jgi:Asp-tRNA(Asn)/Glu-tRNA(Gln) amidotransferase A subunit family amidase
MIDIAQKVLGATDVELPPVFEDIMKRFGIITGYEGLRTTDRVVLDNLDQINPWSRSGIENGRNVTRAQFDAAVHEAEGARAELGRIFNDYDVMITPGDAGEASTDLAAIEGGPFNTLWTHMYVPCLTIPAFVGPNNMPIGLQVVGPQGADEAVLAAGAWIESRLAAANTWPIRVG